MFTGAELWADPLHTFSQATPISYTSPKTGKQYLLVTVPGDGVSLEVGASHSADGAKINEASNAGGGHVIAYALP
ncbi:MAG TPA: hypothetical protein DER02_00075 [Gammaproteobacteria bacterium]|nr:hypothetical protein [Gammaproteobacteria bacterium]